MTFRLLQLRLAVAAIAATLSGCPKASIKAKSASKHTAPDASTERAAGTIAPGIEASLSTREGAVKVPVGAFGSTAVNLSVGPVRTAPELPLDVIPLNASFEFDASDVSGKAVLLAVRPVEAKLHVEQAVSDKTNVFVLVQTSDGKKIAIPPELLTYDSTGADGPSFSFRTYFTDAIYVLVRTEAATVATYRDYRFAAVDLSLADGNDLAVSQVAFDGAARAFVDAALDGERHFDGDGRVLVAWSDLRPSAAGVVVLAFSGASCKGAVVAQSLAKISPAELDLAEDGAVSVQVASFDDVGLVAASACSATELVVDRTGPVLPSPEALRTSVAANPADADSALVVVSLESIVTDAASGVASVDVVAFAGAECRGGEIARATVDRAAAKVELVLATGANVSFRLDAIDLAGNAASSACSSGIFVSLSAGASGTTGNDTTGSGTNAGNAAGTTTGTDTTTNGGPSNPPLDQTPPPPLASVGATTSATTHGVVDVSWTYPAVVSDYARLVIRRVPGASPPSSDCTFGAIVADLTSFSVVALADQTGSDLGGSFSFRFCVTDAAGNLESSRFVANVKAKDSEDPLALATFTAVTGTSHGTIDLSIGYDAGAVPDYQSVEVRRIAGATAPDASCTVGAIAFSSVGPFGAPEGLADSTGSNLGAHYSYRACIRDRADNLTSSQTLVNVQAKDAQAPSQLSGYTASVGASDGDVDLVLDFPGDVSDYAAVTVRRKLNVVPDASCQGSGETVVKSYGLGQFVHDEFTDATGAAGTTVGYRICVVDGSGNLNGEGTMSLVTSGGGSYNMVFVTKFLYSIAQLADPDGVCQAEAVTAGRGAGNFIAIVSTSAQSVHAKLTSLIANTSLPIRMVNGIDVAANVGDLFDGSLLHEINFDLQPFPRSGFVWTGSAVAGTTADNCIDFTDNNAIQISRVGDLSSSNGAWIEANSKGCDESHRIYCLSRQAF